MAGARNNELRMTLLGLGLALLGMLLLSHTAAPVEAAVAQGEDSFTVNSAGGRSLSSFSMNNAEGEPKGAAKKPTAAGDF